MLYSEELEDMRAECEAEDTAADILAQARKDPKFRRAESIQSRLELYPHLVLCAEAVETWIAESYAVAADQLDCAADPYAYHGVRRSDFR